MKGGEAGTFIEKEWGGDRDQLNDSALNTVQRQVSSTRTVVSETKACQRTRINKQGTIAGISEIGLMWMEEILEKVHPDQQEDNQRLQSGARARKELSRAEASNLTAAEMF